MSEANIDRVREDLAVMKHALGNKPTCERDLFGHNLSMAGLGALIVAIGTISMFRSAPLERGAPAHLAYAAAIVVPALVMVAISTVVSYRRRAAAPLFWRENRQSLGVAAVICPLYVAFVAWTWWLEVPAAAISTATLFLFGLFMFGVALVDPARRHWWGWAVATMLAGAASPLCSFRTSWLLVGCWLLVGGLLSLPIIALSLRREGQPHGD